MTYTYRFPRPALTVDCVVFGVDDDQGLQVLLIRRGEEPFKGCWALPGGFVNMDEDTDTAARRELEEETSVRDVFLEQLYTFSAPDRDPRERVVSVAYYALVRPKDLQVIAGSDATDAEWWPVYKILPLAPLAFDHNTILTMAVERLRGKVRYQPIGFELLPEKFTLGQLRHLYQHILGREIDKRNFRRKIFALGVVEPLEGEFVSRGAGRPAQLYRFDREEYEKKTKQGFLFEL